MRKVAVGIFVIVCILAISIVPLAASVKVTDEFKLDGTLTFSYESTRGYLRTSVPYGVPAGLQLLCEVKSGDWTLEWGNTNRGYLTYSGLEMGEFQLFNNQLMTLATLWRTMVPRQVGAQFENDNFVLRVSNNAQANPDVSFLVQPSYDFGAPKVTAYYIVDAEDDINAWAVRLDYDMGNIDLRAEYGMDDTDRSGYLGRFDWNPEGPVDFYSYYYDDIRGNKRWRSDLKYNWSPKCYSNLGTDVREGRDTNYYAKLAFNL